MAPTCGPRSNVRAVRDSLGEPVLYEGSMEDITERRRSQEQLRPQPAVTRIDVPSDRHIPGEDRPIPGFLHGRTPGQRGPAGRGRGQAVELAREHRHRHPGGRRTHDLGKINVPVRYLCKPGRLTGLEWEFMKQHAAMGYEILRDIEFPWPVAEIVHAHHERLDGFGLPARPLR